MKVLAGVDGTQKSLDAIHFASRMLDPSQDSFVFYYRPPEIKLNREDELVPSLPADLQERLVHDVFAGAQNMLPAEFHQRNETIVGTTRPSDGLIQAAAETGAGLIVVGADARNRSFGPFLGGVARRVVREASVPVLVYRQRTDASETERPLNVLLAHDGSSAATEAGEQLTRFHWHADTTGVIARVMAWIDIRIVGDPTPPTVWRNDYERYQKKAKSRAEQVLVAERDEMPRFLQMQPPIIEEGAAVQTLCNLATSQESDLIVVAPHNQGLLRNILGATTESLIHYAPCSVLVAHRT
jgi:nucleotide-binding universal stress UspA family protein